MMTFWIIFLFWMLIIFTHEFGHCLAYYLFVKRWPKMSLRWYGIIIDGPQLQELTFRQFLLVNLLGVFYGYIAMIIMFPDKGLYENVLYYALSSLDIVSLISISRIRSEYKDIKMKDVMDVIKLGDGYYKISMIERKPMERIL